MNPAKVIIVNGSSSAGKSSMCRDFQEISNDPYFLLGIDVFWFSMAHKEIDLERVSDQYYQWCQESTDTGLKYFRILPGPLLNESMLARYKAMAAYLDRGLNVIADEVYWNREWLFEALRVFKNYSCYFVGIFCDDVELSRREIERGDRYLGWARGSQIYTHKDAIYDLQIDNTHKSPMQCAIEIKDFVERNPNPGAAILMRAKFEI